VIDLAIASERTLSAIRGGEIGMIFQEPLTSLNPVLTAGEQVAEVLRLHQKLGRAAARARTLELFAQVGIPAPDSRYAAYPHQLSGGMRQRVMIAMAIACGPQLLIADEPTTALDVTIQAQILDLLHDLQLKLGMAILFITHDLGVVAETCAQVVVMYAGKVVERGLTRDVLDHPRHHYTAGLLASRVPDADGSDGPRTRLPMIPDAVRPQGVASAGCPFADRCAAATEVCWQTLPPLEAMGPGVDHLARCHHPRPLAVGPS
jgi:peptide/nickel transport system ATP-binding protein